MSFRKCWSCPSEGLAQCSGSSPCPPPHSAPGSVPPFPRQACSSVLHPGRIWAVFTVFPYFHPTGCGLSVFPDRLCDRGVSSKATLSPLPPVFCHTDPWGERWHFFFVSLHRWTSRPFTPSQVSPERVWGPGQGYLPRLGWDCSGKPFFLGQT